jgi:hypothetical protein
MIRDSLCRRSPSEMIGSNEGRAAGPVKADSPPKAGHSSLYRGITPLGLHSAADIDERFTSPTFLQLNATEKSCELHKKRACKKVGSPDQALHRSE